MVSTSSTHKTGVNDMQAFSCQVGTEFDSILPHLSDTVEWSLWLKPNGVCFAQEEIKALLAAFEAIDFRCIAWYSTSGRTVFSSAIAEHKRSFGYWPGLVSDIVEQITIDTSLDQRRIYSDVGWLSSTSAEPFTQFLSHPEHIVHRAAFAFIPNRKELGHDWAAIIHGLRWLDHCRKWIETSPVPVFDYSSIVLNYIKLTAHMGGVPGWLWAGTDMRGGIVLFGGQKVLENVVRILGSELESIGVEEFDRHLKRGISLR
jgi:hypothetical protein